MKDKLLYLIMPRKLGRTEAKRAQAEAAAALDKACRQRDEARKSANEWHRNWQTSEKALREAEAELEAMEHRTTEAVRKMGMAQNLAALCYKNLQRKEAENKELKEELAELKKEQITRRDILDALLYAQRAINNNPSAAVCEAEETKQGGTPNA